MSYQLLHGDCLELLPTLDDNSVHCVVTSPPYNLGASPSAQQHRNGSRGSGKNWQGYNGNLDAMPEHEYQAQQRAMLAELYRVLVPGGSLFYIHKDRLWNGELISPLSWLSNPFTVRQQIVWNRGSTHRWDGWHFAPYHEYVFWLTKGVLRGHHLGESTAFTSVWHIPPTRVAGHPAPFPAELARRCIVALTRPNQTILDPYMGSGTTGVACMNTNRRFIGIEKDAAYYAIAEQRIAQAATSRQLVLDEVG